MRQTHPEGTELAARGGQRDCGATMTALQHGTGEGYSRDMALQGYLGL